MCARIASVTARYELKISFTIAKQQIDQPIRLVVHVQRYKSANLTQAFLYYYIFISYRIHWISWKRCPSTNAPTHKYGLFSNIIITVQEILVTFYASATQDFAIPPLYSQPLTAISKYPARIIRSLPKSNKLSAIVIRFFHVSGEYFRCNSIRCSGKLISCNINCLCSFRKRFRASA